MILFIKSHKDFKTTHKAFAQGWNIPIMASTNERGSVIIPYEGKKDFAGDIAYLNNHLVLIDESSPKDGIVELTVSDLANLFSRQLQYPDAQFFEDHNIISYGDFIEQIILRDYVVDILEVDATYALPYIQVANTDTTEFEEPELSGASLFKLSDIIAKAREKGVLFNFYIPTGENILVLDISSPVTIPHNIEFNDGHATLENETFSSTKTAKITVEKATDNDGVYEESVWYLAKDGSVVEGTPPEERADGNWIYLEIGKDDDPEEKAKEEFKKNLSSHKIEFYSDKTYYLWDTLHFSIDGEMLESSVTSVFYSSDNNRYLYKCGDLAVTLTEKMDKANQKE